MRKLFFKFAIGLSIVPGTLFSIALLIYLCQYTFHSTPTIPSHGADIGLGIVCIFGVANIPALICWIGFIVSPKSTHSS
jgi:CBS-domain-containing membrane protein